MSIIDRRNVAGSDTIDPADRRYGISLGVAVKAPARLATTGNQVLSGLDPVDGVTPLDGDRILVWQQNNAVDNGMWLASTGQWSRATDFNGFGEVRKGTRVYVTDGVSYAGREFFVTTPDVVKIGTDEIDFVMGLLITDVSPQPVVGPNSATVGNLPVFSNADGKHLDDSGIPAASLAPLDSPVFVNTPRAPTAISGDSSNQIANTEFVEDAITTALAGAGGNGAAEFETVAAVQAANLPGTVDAVRTLGYWAAGDNGGGLYVRVVSAPSHNAKIQSADGAWWELTASVANVRCLGAKGDYNVGAGTGTSDTTAFQNAVNYCAAKKLAYVYVPSGNYLVDGNGVTVDVSAITGFTDQRFNFIGAGRASTFIYGKVTGGKTALSFIGAAFGTWGASRTRVGGFSLLGRDPLPATNRTGILNTNAIFVDFFDLYIAEFYQAHIIRNCVGGCFEDYTVSFNNYGLLCPSDWSTSSTNELTFLGCHFTSNRQYAAWFNTGANINFYGGSFEANGVAGAWTQDTNRWAVRATNLGQFGASALNFFGTHFELNEGKADVWIAHDAWPATYNFHAADFFRGGTTSYVTNNILFETTGSTEATVNIDGCAFVGVNSYVASSSRKVFDFGSVTGTKHRIIFRGCRGHEGTDKPVVTGSVGSHQDYFAGATFGNGFTASDPDPGVTLVESGHATSRRAKLQFGPVGNGWTLIQDLQQNGTRDLGVVANTTGNVNLDFFQNGDVASRAFYPQITVTYDLGKSANRWGTLYVNSIDYGSIGNLKTYIDSLVVGLLDDRGNYDASGNVFPSSGGSGSAGAVLKGDLWTISVAGTLGGVAVTAGDVVRALVDTPGQTSSNWAIAENNFGYVAENSANKDTDGTLAANSDTKYASQKATKSYADTKVTNPMTTRGDIIVRGASSPQRLALPAANSLYSSDGTDVVTKTLTAILDAVFGNTRGMLLARGATVWGAVALGTVGYALKSDGTDAGWKPSREVLTAARTYYCDWTNGSDSNAGLSAGAGNAFKTIQKAWDTLQTLDLNGFTVTIQLADGTYTSGLAATRPALGGDVVLNGNSGTPTNVVISTTSADAINLSGGARLTVQNLRVQTTTSGNGCVADGAGSKLTTGVGFSLGACASVGLLAQTNGEIRVNNGMTIAGSMVAWLYVQNGGIITASNTVTLSGTPAWGTAGIVFDTTGAISLFGSVSFSGSATGKRYQGTMNALLQSFGAGSASTYFPGNSNGTVATGAQQG